MTDYHSLPTCRTVSFAHVIPRIKYQDTPDRCTVQDTALAGKPTMRHHSRGKSPTRFQIPNPDAVLPIRIGGNGSLCAPVSDRLAAEPGTLLGSNDERVGQWVSDVGE